MSSFTYGLASRKKLDTVHPDLSRVMHMALRMSPYDLTIVWGFRNEDEQNRAFAEHRSKKRWPESKHNVIGRDGRPMSLAVDFAPWCRLPDGSMGIPWNDTHAFAVCGGIIIGAAQTLGIPVRYGGDWDMDGLTTDQTLMDWGHVELTQGRTDGT